MPFIISSLSASDKIPRTSFTPVVTAFTLRKLDLVVFAMISASVDFPQPGGPKKMQEVSLSASMARRSSLPFPTICSWPINSSSTRGRIRSAKGAPLAALPENKSMPFPPFSGLCRRPPVFCLFAQSFLPGVCKAHGIRFSFCIRTCRITPHVFLCRKHCLPAHIAMVVPVRRGRSAYPSIFPCAGRISFPYILP